MFGGCLVQEIQRAQLKSTAKIDPPPETVVLRKFIAVTALAAMTPKLRFESFGRPLSAG